MQDSFLSSFTPSLMSPQDLEAIFVQREELIEDLMASVRESATTRNKHYRLLIGMRGIGKTHTIALLYHRLREVADLKDKLIIAWLKEEEWGVSSWLDLQICIFRALGNSYPQEYRGELAANVEVLYNLSPEEATVKGEIILKEFIGDCTLLILTENWDEILKGLGDKEQKKFKAYLQDKSFITIVATAQNLSNDLKSKKKAFYDFFEINNLDKLSLDQVINLLTKISLLQKDHELNKFIRSQTGRDRIKAIHHLAGGNHRVYIIFSQFLTRDSLDDLVKPVMQTLDELTPYYQARMQWLSPQQRKIIELLCDRRHAVPVKEIAQRCFISHQTASSQLKDLLNKGYVVKETQGRESFYELLEPLMRICLETKKQRGEPIRLFVDFLCIWYTDEELRIRLESLPKDCLETKYIIQALKDNNNFKDLYLQGVNLLNMSKGDEALSIWNDLVSIDPNDSSLWNNQGIALCMLEEYDKAIYSFKKAVKIDSANESAWLNYGISLCVLQKYENSISCFEKVIELNPNEFQAWIGIANALNELCEYKDALYFYNKALEINSEDYEAYCHRGRVLFNLDQLDEALSNYNQAIVIDSGIDSAWIEKGTILIWLGRLNEALASFEQALKINPKNDSALLNLGITYINLQQYEKAIKYFKKVIEIDTKNFLALMYLGQTLFEINKYNEGFTFIKNALSCSTDIRELYDSYTGEIIEIIFNNKQNKKAWKSIISELVDIHDEFQAIILLAKGIIRSIYDLLSEMVSNKAARTWLEVWQEVAGDKPELEIILRFLKTAVEYKETGRDSKVLLQLPKEERDLFVDLLKDFEEVE